MFMATQHVHIHTTNRSPRYLKLTEQPSFQLSPYPTDTDMQRELQATIDWQAFRHTTFRSTLRRLEKARAVRS